MTKRPNIRTRTPLRLIVLMVISFVIVQFASAAHTHEAGHEAPEEHQHCSVCLIATEPDDMPVIESNDRLDDNAEDLFEDSPLISKSCIFSETLSSNVLLYVSSCLLYTSPSPRDRQKSRMPSSA